jgi:hypothetical protein
MHTFIRTQGLFAGAIDFNATLREPRYLRSQSGTWLILTAKLIFTFEETC